MKSEGRMTTRVVQHKYLDLSKSVAIAFYGGGSSF
jgi:hypothetical protein